MANSWPKDYMIQPVWWYLVEALRRFECFAVRRDHLKWTLEDLQKAWTGLGSPTSYKAVYEAGLMKPHDGQMPHRRSGWWVLTERAAKIVLAWHNAGHNCGDGWDVVHNPQMKYPEGTML